MLLRAGLFCTHTDGGRNSCVRGGVHCSLFLIKVIGYFSTGWFYLSKGISLPLIECENFPPTKESLHCGQLLHILEQLIVMSRPITGELCFNEADRSELLFSAE